MLLRLDLHGLGLLAVYPKSDICHKCLYVVCHFLYSCQHVTKRKNATCEVKVSQPLLTPIDYKTGVVHHFSHDKVDGDEEEKRGENATLPHACLNDEHLGISNTCFHTVAEVQCLEYVDEFARDPVKFQCFPE